MKTVILAGGLGTRISEESLIRPKPMVEIGGKPMLWHIMNIYYKHGITDFIVCCGYKGNVIKDYFVNYSFYNSDLVIDIGSGNINFLKKNSEPWTVTLVDTGEFSQTGGRLMQVRDLIGNDDFCMTYGDAVSSVNINDLITFHKNSGTLATVTAVAPPARFGSLEIENGAVRKFSEKAIASENLINGGFFVLNPKVFDLIDNEMTIWEKEPLEALAQRGELSAFLHTGFWKPMDTLKDKNELEQLWSSGFAPWI